MTMQNVKRFTLVMLLLSLIAAPVLEAYYDPYIGRFLKRDPAKHGVNWYAYTYNNPMKYTDPTGKVPTQDQTGNVAGFMADFFPDPPQSVKPNHPDLSDFGTRIGLDGPHPANKEVQDKFRRQKDPEDETKTIGTENRYIHTKDYGWIDMKHFMAAAALAVKNRRYFGNRTLAYIITLRQGAAVEQAQLITQPNSAYSYEDLLSNKAGAIFGAYDYDPSKPLGPQIKAFLNNATPTADPETLETHKFLAPSEGEVNDSHLHRHWNYKPFNLDNLNPNN